jgi:hypothetical protein
MAKLIIERAMGWKCIIMSFCFFRILQGSVFGKNLQVFAGSQDKVFAD